MNPHELDKINVQILILGIIGFVMMYSFGLWNIFKAKPDYLFAVIDFIIGTINLVLVIYNTRRKYK